MADLDAEMSFLSSMQAMNNTAESYGVDGGAGDQQHSDEQSEEEYDPAQAVDNDFSMPHQVSVPTILSPPDISLEHNPPDSTSPLQVMASTSKRGTPAAENPSTSFLSSQDLSRTGSGASIRPTADESKLVKSRNIGGLIVDDDSDEDTPAQSVALNGVLDVAGGSSNVLKSLSHTPQPEISPSDVSIPITAQTQGDMAPVKNSVSDSVSNLAAIVPDTVALPNNAGTPKPDESLPAPQVAVPEPPVTTAAPRVRLPHDRVGILEDRIKEDPRGDIDAWISLISEHRKRNKLEDARNVYERFFKLFPAAAEQWVAYASMESQNNDFFRLEQIFNRSLLTIPNIQLWSLYLDYIRRRNNLTTDTSGNARQIISQAYDFALQNIGIDKDSGRIWQDYVQFIRSGPGIIGGSSWQDQQKMDLLRKTYQRAICVPTQAVNALWKEYDAFEMGLNKMTGRKFLQEKSPAYMTARSSNIELQNITRDLQRTTLPRLPPALGFDGDVEFGRQLDIWKRWIQWEKDDPLVLKQEDAVAYRARISYVYKQALMALRFWPDMWFDASEFCFQNGLETEGNDFLTQGMAANPESCLLAFKRADRLEITSSNEEGEESAKRRGMAVREPYDKVLDALYDLITKTKTREAQAIARIEEQHANQNSIVRSGSDPDGEDDLDDADTDAKEAAKKAQIEAVQNVNGVQIRLLSRTVSFAWIALMRAMRRVQGKGKVGDAVGGSRQIFTDARKRGRLTSDVYVASALLEHHCYKDPAATKIFERGMKLFPDDEGFALEYLKHLIAVNDITNARAVFETTVSRLTQKPENLPKAKPIYAFFHEYEAHYGELTQVSKLEKRMSDLFPEDPMLMHFARRFTTQGFDPTAIRPIISPATQARPKSIPSIETPESAQKSPPSRYLQTSNSPKRSFPADDSDNEASRPRKLHRGESPLKGAAGRRLDQQKRNLQPNNVPRDQGQHNHQTLPPPLLPRDVLFLLSIIPKAETYHATRFRPEQMVRLLRETNIPNTVPQARPPPMEMKMQPIPQMMQGQQNGGYPRSTSTFRSSPLRQDVFNPYQPDRGGHYDRDGRHNHYERLNHSRQNVEQRYSTYHDHEILGVRRTNSDLSMRHPSSSAPYCPSAHVNLLSSISPDDINFLIEAYKHTAS